MEKKSYKYLLLSALTLLIPAKFIVAQNLKSCGTTEATQALHAAHPELVEKEANYNTLLLEQAEIKKQQKSTQTAEQVFRIPIVFHIIHINGSENISDAQVLDEVAILNRDYAKLNADSANIIANTPFDTLSTRMNIEFRLARIDPNGNCTNGIDRIYSHRTNNADDASKLNPWPRNKYLNVWVVKTIGQAGVAGYAFFPSDADATPNVDGVIILNDYIGSIGTSALFSSRALTHEIGHFLSLYHPWGGTNSPEVACGDDVVEDTPITMGHLSCDLYTPHCDAATFSTAYRFSDVTPTSGLTDPTLMAPTPGVSFGVYSANGVSDNSNDSMRFSFTKWDTGALDSATVYDSLTGTINTSKYYEVTVAPAYGSSMTLTGLTFDFQRSATGVRTYAVRSSVDGFASNLAASISPANANLSVQTGNVFFYNQDTTSSQSGSKISLSGTNYTNRITPVTFRFYGWNAEDSLGTFSIDNPTFAGSAGTIENTQNYMDYSYCSVMFTKGQKDRMRNTLGLSISGRNHLWQEANLIATGTDDAGQLVAECIPHPDFFSNRNSICAGGTITYTKNILLGTATSAVWTFDGGTPATSTAASPTVTYSTPGDYAVKLTASNASGSDSVIKNFFIHVSNPWSQYTGLAVENFDNVDSYYSNWVINNYDGNNGRWVRHNTVGFSGTHSMMLAGYGDYPADVDDFITPVFDLSHVTGGSMTFRCAAASKALSSTDLNDVLKVYSSTNCGQTWTVRGTFTGSALINAGYHPESFVPNSSSQWALQTVTIPNASATNNVRFKFEYTSGNESNNIYIDDINIVGTLGVEEKTLDEASILVYPNPANQTATVSYHLSKRGNTKIELVDLLGKKVMDITNNDQAEGDYSVQISKQEHAINSGIYFVKISMNNSLTTKKLIFTE
jgi:PKD repeat protein